MEAGQATAGEVTEGIDHQGVTAWMRAAIPDSEPPFRFELIAGGRSNLTFRVTDGDGRSFALRRPPVSHVLPTAHDMKREYTVISALGPTGVPVPRTLGLCSDESVNGAPFYVMSFVEGNIVRDEWSAGRLDESSRARAGESLIQTLATLHAVDVDVVGLGDFARRDGYIARQLKRWHGQFTQSTLDGQAGPAVVDRVHHLLEEQIPEQQGGVIVHGDYRLDNTVLDDSGNVRAILDWEICTLGDPLADLGLLMVYWAESEDRDQSLIGVAPTVLPGFARRSELLDRYAALTGRDVSGIAYYRAFGFWKLACILQGVHVRYAGGAAAGDRSGVDQFAAHVVRLGERALAEVESLVIDRDPSSLYQFDPQWGEPVDQRLTRPVMVVGLDGWVDAGMGASTAIAELITSSPTMQVVTFDTEMLVDQRARRPIVRLEDGVTTELTWPVIRMVAGKDRVGADIVYLTGPEPDFRWPTFIEAVVGLVHDLQVRTVVGLGAFPAPTPHTRPVRLASTVPPQSADLAGRVGTVRGTLEVPAGVQAALEVSLGMAEVPVIGLWARVPHYVSAMPYPEASAALIEGLCAVTGTVLDSSSLRRAGEESRRQVDELIGANPEHLEMVRRLEAALDSEEVSSTGLDVDVPSGDEIAAELEQFLRGEGHREA